LVGSLASAALTAPTAFGSASLAQEPASNADVSEVVVTGTRDAATTALTSTAPVDVITAHHLADTGLMDLGRALEDRQPEINVVRASAQPTASSARPLTLNGLYQDELLVLIDGKRHHASSVLDTNNGPGRGSAPYDLNTIPEDAIDHIEVLRDGASAQYGSDAIAGVVNIILKTNAHGGDAAVQAGVTGHGDGANGDLSANSGFKLGETGFINVTGEVPTAFYVGAPVYSQDVTDLTFTRPLPELWAGGTLAAGGQVRYEHYQILNGDAASFEGAEAATLPGFNPSIPVNNGRTAAAGFVDLELKPAHWLTLDAAGRYDHYTDFGGGLTYTVYIPLTKRF
jgi:outer membrane receptor protein involved in Fe transport